MKRKPGEDVHFSSRFQSGLAAPQHFCPGRVMQPLCFILFQFS